MPQAQRRGPWPCVAFAAALSALACPATAAKDPSAPLREAAQYLENGNLKAAQIELRNAIRDSPQDPVIRARLAEVYLKLGDPAAAEVEARAARELNGDERDYLLIFADALFRQNKFAELLLEIRPGDRDPAFESKIRVALGSASAALRDWD